MKKAILDKIKYLSLIMALMVLGGCDPSQPPLGDSPENVSSKSDTKINVEKDTFQESRKETLRINELSWPNPDLALASYMSESIKMQPGEFVLEEKNIWREVWLYDSEYHPAGTYLEKLESPYDHWEVCEIEDSFVEGESEYFVGKHYSFDGKWTFCILRDLESNELCWGKCENDKVIEVLGTIPAECKNCTFFVSDPDAIFAYEQGSKKMFLLNEHMEKEKEYTFRESILSIIPGSTKENFKWCGYTETEFGIYDLFDHGIIPEESGIDATWAHSVKENDDYYIFTERKVFILRQDTVELILDLGVNDYPLEEIDSVMPQSDGSIWLLGDLDNQKVLIQFNRTLNVEKEEKQEIIFASTFQHAALQKSISRFNRRNEKYHITTIVKQENEVWEDYIRQLQMKMSLGEGPDLLLDDAVTDLNGYAQNGYLEEMDDLLSDRQDIFEPAIEGGKINGHVYGIPYDFSLQFSAYSEDAIGNRESLTVDDLMKIIGQSGAEMLQYAADGTDIILWYGLYDNENKTYIDWEKKVSHLEEAPFKELLEFAKKYKDPLARQHQSKMDTKEGEYLLEGKALATSSTMFDVTMINSLNACFQGKPKMLGYPARKGNGIYMKGRYLYVNSASDCKEGIIEFLEFLTSKEEQTAYSCYEPPLSGSEGYVAYFPIQKEAFDELLKYEKTNENREHASYLFDERGLSYDGTLLTDNEAEQIRWLVEHAKASNWNVLEIQNMIEEELEPFFVGERDLEEAAKRLHNRVQLYLDEGK